MTYTEPEPTPADAQPVVPGPDVDTSEHYENEPPDPAATEQPEVEEQPTDLDLQPPASSGPAQSV
jgi:hypothetical protein